MGSRADPDSSLPWVWIIEYMASIKEVDMPIVHNLIEVAPEIPNELVKATSEMVALRCLEDLFGTMDKVNHDGLSARERKVKFAKSESCEGVLQKILQEISDSDIKMGGPELLKWDVQPFIMHKRAALPKCALQQLKDKILEGTHPVVASLKEGSGLMCVNGCDTARVGDLDHNAQANLCPSTSENREDGFHIRNMLPLKRGTDDMAIRDVEQNTNDFQENCDLNYNAKRHKQDASTKHQSADQISVATCEKEIGEPLSGGGVAVARGEVSHIANQSQDEGLEESKFHEDECDSCDDLRRLGKNGEVNDDQNQHRQAVNGHTADKRPQAKPLQIAALHEMKVTEPKTSTDLPSAGTQRKETMDESTGEMEHSGGEEMSSNHYDYQNQRVDVAVRKSHLLCFQSSLGCSSLPTSGGTEENLCVKCNKDGQLLSCSTGTCPFLVHETCLGFPKKLDEMGNFHCPFCAYSRAISEYIEAKKKAFVARKNLTAFVKMGLECHQMMFATKNPGHSRSHGDKDVYENGHVGGHANNIDSRNGQCIHVNNHLSQKGRTKKKKVEPSASCFIANSPGREEEANTLSDRNCDSHGDKVTEENRVNECSPERGLEGQLERIPIDHQSDSEKLAIVSFVPVDHLEAEDEDELQDEGAQHAGSGLPEKPVICLYVDEEESCRGENDNFIISNYSIQYRRQETRYTLPVIPQLRRKKVPWTAQEEAMLKKGVLELTSAHDRKIPWTKILEFGSSVFLSGRTTVDLKDKWRNMCKATKSRMNV